MSKWMLKAKQQGLIKHICASFHDSNENLIKLIDAGYVDAITLQYNMLDRSLETGIAHAKEKNIGITIMGPVGGGRLGADSDVLSGLVPSIRRVPELALRFVLANPNVSIALSGMTLCRQVEENVAVASDSRSFSAEDMKTDRRVTWSAERHGRSLLHGLQLLKPVRIKWISPASSAHTTWREFTGCGAWPNRAYAGLVKNGTL